MNSCAFACLLCSTVTNLQRGCCSPGATFCSIAAEGLCAMCMLTSMTCMLLRSNGDSIRRAGASARPEPSARAPFPRVLLAWAGPGACAKPGYRCPQPAVSAAARWGPCRAFACAGHAVWQWPGALQQPLFRHQRRRHCRHRE
jgi:hypothetical protein